MKAKLCQKPIAEKKDKRKNKRWTHDETILLFNYLQDTINRGKSIEKPTAIDYYKAFLQDNPMTNCTVITVRDKVRHLKEMYTAAVKWSNVTGQGIRQESETSFEAALLKQFKYFKEAEEIWGCKLSIHVPYVATSSAVGPNCSNSPVAIYIDTVEPTVDVLDFGADDVTFEDITESTTTSSRSPSCQSSSVAETFDEDELTVQDQVPCNAKAKANTSKSVVAGSSTAGKFLTPPKTKVLPKTARDTYLEATKMRTEASRERMSFQKEQLAVEKLKTEADVQLRREQFEFEKEIRRSELELRRAQMDNDANIRMKA